MSVSPERAPQTLGAWLRLAGIAKRHTATSRAGRATGRSRRLGPIYLDYSKQALDDEVVRALVELASESDLAGAIEQLSAGARVNNTEDRPALHMALRAPSSACPDEVSTQRERFLALADAVRPAPGLYG